MAPTLGPSDVPQIHILGGYDSSSESDTPEATTPRSGAPPSSGSSRGNHTDFLFPPHSGFSSTASTAASTPTPSRSTSPLPQFFEENPSSCSDTDSEPDSPLLRNHRSAPWDEDNQRWWAIGVTRRRRRRRDGRNIRKLKKWSRIIVRHPLFPRQPITIVLTLLLLSLFAVSMTFLLIHILNPDKEPLPWRAYCSVPASSKPPTANSASLTVSPDRGFQPPFPPDNFDSLPPAGVFIGVFSMDSAFERRMLVRTTWAKHGRSRDGAGDGDGGVGTSRSIVRFILGQPRKAWEHRIKLEMELYNDIVILPITENMNYGKTHAYFSWASANAWVPPVYTNFAVPTPRYTYSNQTAPPPPLAKHDSKQAWADQAKGTPTRWVRPDFAVKVDDDSFVMVAELEARLRHQLHMKIQHRPASVLYSYDGVEALEHADHPGSTTGSTYEPATTTLLSRQSHNAFSTDPLIYWGYLVKNRFMGGELYALSWSLVDWVANDAVVKSMIRGAEDKTTAKWMKLHPRAREIRWASERCWIHDHPRAGTVYSHGYLFPSEVQRVRKTITPYLDKTPLQVFSGPLAGMKGYLPPTPASWAYSSVSTFGVRYAPPIANLTSPQNVEALVEGSPMSKIREGGRISAENAWSSREGREKRYEGKRVGGTIVVHFIKKNVWFLETALALLEGPERTETEDLQRGHP